MCNFKSVVVSCDIAFTLMAKDPNDDKSTLIQVLWLGATRPMETYFVKNESNCVVERMRYGIMSIGTLITESTLLKHWSNESPPNNTFWSPLQWCHNGHNGFSNHQPHNCLLNCLFRCKSKKTSKLCVAGLCGGNWPVTGEFPAQMASNTENVSIWWHPHALNSFQRLGIKNIA